MGEYFVSGGPRGSGKTLTAIHLLMKHMDESPFSRVLWVSTKIPIDTKATVKMKRNNGTITFVSSKS